ncbi:MAG: hypothetical protein ACR2GD_05545 [Pyrinomonadaceae bacterium]
MCCSKGLLKRFVPFFAAFAFGLLVANFFVSVAAPSFQFGRGWHRQSEYRRCWRMENQRQNFQFGDEREIRQNADSSYDINKLVPPPPPLSPVAPRPVR